MITEQHLPCPWCGSKAIYTQGLCTCSNDKCHVKRIWVTPEVWNTRYTIPTTEREAAIALMFYEFAQNSYLSFYHELVWEGFIQSDKYKSIPSSIPINNWINIEDKLPDKDQDGFFINTKTENPITHKLLKPEPMPGTYHGENKYLSWVTKDLLPFTHFFQLPKILELPK